MTVLMRRNTLISQHVEVALVYRNMLGMDDARAYLARENVPESIALRILGDGNMRDHPVAPVSQTPAPVAQFTVCRRRNHLHDAIEAAIKIERRLGRDWALALLHNEKVPDHVAARIMVEGPRQVRCKPTAAE